jgi:DNA-binding response OmpR family regulator
MKILVADDDEVVRTFVHRVVEQSQHDVLLAEDGRQALALVEREDPDLLITDLRMPELDGFGLIEAVRSSPGREGLPIICLSSVNQREDVAKLIAQGISDYVLKPVRPGELANRIRAVAYRERNWKSYRNVLGSGSRL